MRQTSPEMRSQMRALELEIDEVVAAETKALDRVEQTLERQKSSPKRRKSISELERAAALARQAIKLKTARKIERLKFRAGILGCVSASRM